MDCIATIPSGGLSRARALITVFEKIKNSPAINPDPIADKSVKVNIILSVMIDSFSTRRHLRRYYLHILQNPVVGDPEPVAHHRLYVHCGHREQ